jgi:lysophospholipase L1-like esterase
MRLFAFLSLSLALIFPNTAEVKSVQKTIILGDSIVASIRNEIAKELPNTIVNAYRSRTVATSVLTDTGLAQLENLSMTKSQHWIVELGTNDAWSVSLTLKQIQIDIQRFAKRLLEVTPNKTCITWILPAIVSPVAPNIQKRAASVRRLLLDAKPKKHCWAFINWHDEVKANRALVGKDGVHLSPTGKIRFMALLKSVIK